MTIIGKNIKYLRFIFNRTDWEELDLMISRFGGINFVFKNALRQNGKANLTYFKELFVLSEKIID